MNRPDFTPEYNFTQDQIDAVNGGKFSVLEREWHTEQGNEALVTGLDNVDADEYRELVTGLYWDASYYAKGVKARVEEMYGEAYAANEYQTGPDQYFEDQKHPVRARVSRFLGSFTLGR